MIFNTSAVLAPLLATAHEVIAPACRGTAAVRQTYQLSGGGVRPLAAFNLPRAACVRYSSTGTQGSGHAISSISFISKEAQQQANSFHHRARSCCTYIPYSTSARRELTPQPGISSHSTPNPHGHAAPRTIARSRPRRPSPPPVQNESSAHTQSIHRPRRRRAPRGSQRPPARPAAIRLRQRPRQATGGETDRGAGGWALISSVRFSAPGRAPA